MRSNFRSIFKDQAFKPSRWSVLVNPFYIIRRRLYLKVAAIAPSIGGSIIDIGCGSKPFRILFSSAKSYVGVDVEVSGHSHADSQIDVFYDGVTLPFPDRSFDNAVSFEVFEHVFNLEHLLREISRVLKTDGRLVVSVPFGWDEHEVPYDFARYTTFGIRHIIENAGFGIERLDRTNNFIEALGQLFILYFYFISRSRIKALNQIVQIAIIFPMTLFFLLAAKILPRRHTFFSGIVFVAKKLG